MDTAGESGVCGDQCVAFCLVEQVEHGDSISSAARSASARTVWAGPQPAGAPDLDVTPRPMVYTLALDVAPGDRLI